MSSLFSLSSFKNVNLIFPNCESYNRNIYIFLDTNIWIVLVMKNAYGDLIRNIFRVQNIHFSNIDATYIVINIWLNLMDDMHWDNGTFNGACANFFVLVLTCTEDSCKKQLNMTLTLNGKFINCRRSGRIHSGDGN